MNIKKIIKPFLNPYFLIFLLALIVRIGYLVWFFKFSGELHGRPYLPTSDRRFYDSIAQSIANGYGINWYNIFKAHYPPFYPIFLSFIYSLLGHSYLLTFFVQTILSSFCPVFVFIIAKNISNKIIAFLSAIIIVFYQPFVNVIADLSLENLIIFLMLFYWALLVKLKTNSSLVYKITTGLVLGMTILTKPIFLTILPFITFIWILILFPKNKFISLILPIALACGLLLSAWLTRNYLIYKRIFFSSQSGTGIWFTINPEFGDKTRLKAREIILSSKNFNEGELNELYAKKGLANLKENPDLFKKQFFSNWITLFYNDNHYNYKLFFLLLPAGGFLLALHQKKLRLLLVGFFLLIFYLQYTLLYTYPRFRIPADWILVILSVSFLVNLFKNFIFKKKVLAFNKFLNRKNFFFTESLFLKLFIFLILIYSIKIFIVYRNLKTINYQTPELTEKWERQKNNFVNFNQVQEWQNNHHGDITPYIGKTVFWKGEISYINRNAVYPLGGAKDAKRNTDPEYLNFYDMYFLPSTGYSTLDLIIDRGIKPGYYGQGIVMINYRGLIDFKYQNGDHVFILGKIIGQNHMGQIYLEGLEIFNASY